MARIEISWEGNTREYNIEQEIVIGRDESCDIKIPSIKASRRHCRIFKGTGGYFIEDLGSSNGTVLNGIIIGRKLLKHNDEINVGRIKLRFIDKTEDPLIGKRLGQYQIIEKIGVGAEGTVYHGRQIALNKDVAVKLLRNDFIKKNGGVEVLREASNSAVNFDHPNVVDVYEFTEEKGRFFYSMELVQGEDLLSKCIRKKRIKVIDVIQYGLSISSALSALHSNGLLHGDIKPHNILVDNNKTVKLIDLGWLPLPKVNTNNLVDLGSEEETEESRFESKRVFATPQYVAPELIKHQSRTEQSDIYALSVSLYQLLTGELPYKSTNIKELLKQHIVGDVKNPAEVNSKIPAELADLVLLGMSSDRKSRIKTAEEYHEKLKEIYDQVTKNRQQKKEEIVKKIREKRFGKMHFGLGYKVLALFVVILLVISYALRAYKEYSAQKEKEQIEQLELARDLYNNANYDRAKNALNLLLESDLPENLESEASRILGLLELPDAVKELQNLKKKFQAGEIPKSKVVNTLKLKIRSKELSINVQKEYLGYLKSIGGDVDVRYEWQKKVDLSISTGHFIVAYDILFATSNSNFDKYEQVEYERYLQRVTIALNKIIEEEYNQANEYLKSGKIIDATLILENIVDKYPSKLGWSKRIMEFFAENNDSFCSEVSKNFNASLVKVSQLDIPGLSEDVFRLERYAAKQVSKVNISAIVDLPKYLNAFSNALTNKIKRIKVDTGKSALIEVMIDGKSEIVELEVDGEKFIASAKDSKFAINMHEIIPSSIEKILPPYEVTEEEAIGAGIYFTSLADNSIAAGYFEAANSGKNAKYKEELKKFIDILSGYIQIITKEKNNLKIYSSSSVKLAGSSIIFPVNSSEYIFETGNKGKLIIDIKDSSLELFFEKDYRKISLGKAVVMPHEGGMIEIKGYWDKLIISQNDIIVGSVEKGAIGDIIVAPIKGSIGRAQIRRKISIKLPDVGNKPIEDDSTEALG